MTTKIRISARCAIETCPKRISIRFLMCRPHWRMVPRDLQRDVLDTLAYYYSKDRGRIGYFKARERAIAAVNKKIEERRIQT